MRVAGDDGMRLVRWFGGEDDEGEGEGEGQVSRVVSNEFLPFSSYLSLDSHERCVALNPSAPTV